MIHGDLEGRLGLSFRLSSSSLFSLFPRESCRRCFQVRPIALSSSGHGRMDAGGIWQVPWPGHNLPSVGPGGVGTEFLRCLFLPLLPRSCPFFFLAQQHPVNILSESTEHHVAFAVAGVDFHGHLLRDTLQLLDRSVEPLPVDDLAKGVLSKRRAISFRSRDDTSIEPQGSAQEPRRSRPGGTHTLAEKRKPSTSGDAG